VASVNSYGALPSAVHTFEPAPVFTDPDSTPQLILDSTPSAFSTLAPDIVGVSLALDAVGDGLAASGGGVKRLAENLPELAPRRALPLPANRSAASPSSPQTAQHAIEAAAATAAPDNRSFFEKLFDLPQQPSGTALAYAQPEDSAIGSQGRSNKSIALPFSNTRTAIYDISARTLYMPNGDRLEAHSGLGDLLDDPDHVDVIDRGATPPNTYELALRNDLFHGVQALRLNPVSSGNMFHRTGLLAHPFMLGPDGDSNGCVSVKDYSEFLQAFLNGEVTRLVVVSHVGSSG